MINKNTPLKKTVFDKIDFKKIGTGRHFTEGSFDSKKNIGLKGQLGNLKRSGRFTSTANLSKKNLQTMYDMLKKKLDNKVVNSKVSITRQEQKSIMHEAYKLTKQSGGDFTKEDMEDLRKVVDKLKNTSEEAVIPTRNNKNINNISPDDYLNRQTATNIKSFLEPIIKLNNPISKINQSINIPQQSIEVKDEKINNTNKFKEDINDNDSDDIPDPSSAKDMPI